MKGLVIGWSTNGGDQKTYLAWERIPKMTSDDVGGRLLLIDATEEQLSEFVEAFDPA
jgi:hypothetical protein